MKTYAAVLRKFEKILHQNDWPQILWITPGMYWDVIIASEGEIIPDWRFHPTGEDEGFPYFLIGPTMVRPQKRTNSVALATFAPNTKEEHFVEEWEKNESIQPEFKAKIKEMVEDGELRIETVTVDPPADAYAKVMEAENERRKSEETA